jgi:hypothetical protein
MKNTPAPKCVLCKTGNVVPEILKKDAPFSMDMPVGDEDSRATYSVRFHCDNLGCQILYRHPPGQPTAERKVLEKHRRSLQETEY